MNVSDCIHIGDRLVGHGQPVYVVAEMSANHGQDFDQAVRILRAARGSGADAVKLQTYRPDTLTIDSDEPPFRIGGGTLWDGRTLWDLYSEAWMPWDWYPKLKAVADEIGLDLFSTAFDDSSVDYLDECGVPIHKVASFENVDLALIAKMARTGKPLMISTGMATLEETAEAVEAARAAGAHELLLLKCTSAYPALPSEMNLRAIPDMAERFGVPVGLSDHTMGVAASITSIALGACMIEKHFTLSRKAGGPDSSFSLEPAEFQAMVDAIRIAEQALGQVGYGPGSNETKSLAFRRSLFVVADVKAGEIFTPENVRSIRPGAGLAPKHLPAILGGRAAVDVTRGTPLAWRLVAGAEVPTDSAGDDSRAV